MRTAGTTKAQAMKIYVLFMLIGVIPGFSYLPGFGRAKAALPGPAEIPA